jgi:hypothetical protein
MLNAVVLTLIVFLVLYDGRANNWATFHGTIMIIICRNSQHLGVEVQEQQGIETLDNAAGVSAAKHSALDTDRNPCLPVESSLSSSRYEHCVPHLVAQWRASGGIAGLVLLR